MLSFDQETVTNNIVTIAGMLFWYGFIPYLIYDRVISIYIAHFHYAGQDKKVQSIGLTLPFIGHVI